MMISCGILTVSDTCFRGEKADTSGPNLEKLIKFHFPEYQIKYKKIVCDDRAKISQTLQEWAANKCNLILTTGGTGLSPRDVTPEATKEVIERDIPGMQMGMLVVSLQVTPMATLSRSVCGIKDQSIIINLPGSLKGAAECFSFLVPSIPHALDLVLDKAANVAQLHSEIQTSSKTTTSKVKTHNVADRPRSSTYPMLEVPEAIDLIIKESLVSKIESIRIEDVLNRVLAEDVVASEAIPAFDASVKDGYAVLAANKSGVRHVRNVIAAGDSPNMSPLKSGEVIRISTGAPIPSGADAVVQVEDTIVQKQENGSEIQVVINKAPRPGQDIRKKGSDIAVGTLVLEQGQRLKAAHIGVLATIGKSSVQVYKIPTVGIITTGNELKDHHETLRPGQIRDSNRLTIINLLREHNYACNDCGIVKDNPDAVKSAIERVLSSNDILITTGGVSMGEFDYVKRVLVEDFSAKIHFGRINMKPGKPTTFATLFLNGAKKMIFGLPGNPVSASVTCLLFVIPTLKYLERSPVWQFPTLPYVVSSKNQSPDLRPEYLRVSVLFQQSGIVAEPNGEQASSRLNSLVGANGLLLMPGNMIANKEYLSNIILIDHMNY